MFKNLNLPFKSILLTFITTFCFYFFYEYQFYNCSNLVEVYSLIISSFLAYNLIKKKIDSNFDYILLIFILNFSFFHLIHLISKNISKL